MDLTPPAPSGVTFVPVIATTTPITPATASSLVMPAETPVQLATNSLLTDDPLAVPLKPVRRPASSAGDRAAPGDSSASPGRTNTSSIWEHFDDEGFAEVWSALAGRTSATAVSTGDTLFAESTPAESSDAAAGAGEVAVLADARTQHITGAIGLVAAALLLERGSRTEGNAPVISRRGRRKLTNQLAR